MYTHEKRSRTSHSNLSMVIQFLFEPVTINMLTVSSQTLRCQTKLKLDLLFKKIEKKNRQDEKCTCSTYQKLSGFSCHLTEQVTMMTMLSLQTRVSYRFHFY